MNEENDFCHTKKDDLLPFMEPRVANGSNDFDILKGIGIILMIIGHTKCPKPIKGFIYGFHMPLFFIVAGMLFNKEKWDGLGLHELILKRAKNYLIPYFTLSGVNLVLNAINELSKYAEVNDWLNSQIYHTGWVVYGTSITSQNPNSTPLWFLPCLFAAYPIFYFIVHMNWKGEIGICICLFVLNRIIFNKLPSIAPKTLPWHIEVALIGAIFMIIGYYIKKYEVQKVLDRSRTVWFLVSGVGITAGYFNWGKVFLSSNRLGNPFLLFISSCAMTLSLAVLSAKILETFIGRFFAFCGKSTLIFMGFNYYLNTMTAKLWKRIPIVNRFDYI